MSDYITLIELWISRLWIITLQSTITTNTNKRISLCLSCCVVYWPHHRLCFRANWTRWMWPHQSALWTWTETYSPPQTDPASCTTSWLVGSSRILIDFIYFYVQHAMTWLLRVSSCFLHGIIKSWKCWIQISECLFFFFFWQVIQQHILNISLWTEPLQSCVFCSPSAGTCFKGSHSSLRWAFKFNLNFSFSCCHFFTGQCV